MSTSSVPRNEKIVIQAMFDQAMGYAGFLVALALLGVGVGIGLPPSFLTPTLESVGIGLLPSSLTPTLESNCIAGTYQESAMWVTFVFSVGFLLYAFLFTMYGRTIFYGDSNLKERDLPTKQLYVIIACVLTLIMLAAATIIIGFFFILEVKYMRFQCQPLILRCIIPSFGIGTLFGCVTVIYYVWRRTPYQA